MAKIGDILLTISEYQGTYKSSGINLGVEIRGLRDKWAGVSEYNLCSLILVTGSEDDFEYIEAFKLLNLLR